MKRRLFGLDRRRAVEFARREAAASCTVKQQLGETELGALADWARASLRALAAGRRIYLFGNGGSAADAQHIAAELVGHFRRPRAALPALALTTDTSVLTSVGNDYGFEEIFLRQIEALARPGDVAVGITTSGRSPNVLRALARARTLGCVTVALCGAYTRELRRVARHLVAVPSRDTQRIQEAHALLGDIFCDLVEQQLFPSASRKQKR
jgi:D-sedoheptulose 7-phosphate isomerase